MMPHLSVVFAFTLFAAVPQFPIVEDRCDLVELNHFYDDNGRPVFDQLIYWDWCDQAERFQVRAWRLVKSCWQRPTRDWVRGGYTSIWLDGERLRVVRAAHWRESWTQYDPELSERQQLSADARRELGR